MLRRYQIFIIVFLVWALVGVLSTAAFMLRYHTLLHNTTVTQLMMSLWHGLRLDIAVAGYLTLIPGLLLTLNIWHSGSWISRISRVYFAITSLLYSLAVITNLGLYEYWGFPLDNTPLLYLRTSPTDALASMTALQLLFAVLAIMVCSAGLYIIFLKIHGDILNKNYPVGVLSRLVHTLSFLILTALLLLPIRGGLGTGTNHTGSVYFSTHTVLNHAAVNPVFSFVEAVTHQEEIGTRYRFMNDAEATELFQRMTWNQLRTQSQRRNMNVILVSLESFSDTVMHVPGITPNLLQLLHDGISFQHFYANSFRTDRGLVSIHSALPSQPTMSIMDIPKKSSTLPSIAGALGKRGYSTTFYYGGDINYSNMRSYFVGTGFQDVVSDADFPQKLHTGKWGVADEAVYDRMLSDIKSDNSGQPFFRSIMTESSHEPFDVPNYNKIASSPVLNAFSYADYCLGKFASALRQLPCWKNTILLITADHNGAYPEHADNYQLWRFRVPFVILSGDTTLMEELNALNATEVIGSQIDIAATLLAILGIEHEEFTYSKDLFDSAPTTPHFAYFTFPDAIGIVSNEGYIIYDNTVQRTVRKQGNTTDSLVKHSQAYLQKLYDDLESR